MNFKKWWALSACLSLCFLLISLVLPVRASADSFYFDGYYTISNKNFPNTPFYNPFASPVVNDSVSIPDGYILCGYELDVGYSSPSYPFSACYYYCNPSKVPLSFYQDGDIVYFGSTGDGLFCVENSINSDGVPSFRRARYVYSLSTGRTTQITAFVDTLGSDGVTINRPESQISFNLNVVITDFKLVFNSNINSGGTGLVDYYIFPASAPITGGSSSGFSGVPASDLTVEQEDSLSSKGFDDILKYALPFYKTDNFLPPAVTYYSVASARGGSGTFNPDSYNLAYVKLGTSHLYQLSDLSQDTNNSLDLKAILASRQGVYVNSSLKLVAVTHLENRYFLATYDFNPSQIVGGSPVPPSIIQGPVTPPNPSLNDPDLQDLADYLKNLGNTFNENQIRNDENLIAMLGAMPWSNFIGTGFAGGFANALPNLSFTLDHLFDSLFDKYTAPTDDQINEILADIESERTSLRAKLAFVDDVKTEYYFVISTITADNNSVPPDFEFTLPSLWSGGQTIRCKLVTYEIATPYIMANIKSIITVFLSLALLLHIWRTLPATVGNMPGGDP